MDKLTRVQLLRLRVSMAFSGASAADWRELAAEFKRRGMVANYEYCRGMIYGL